MACQKPIRLISVFALVMGFALILPAHHHGWLTVDDAEHGALAAHPASIPQKQHESPERSHHDSSHCVICLIGRTLDVPQSVAAPVPQLELAAVCPAALPESIAPREFFPAFFGRAPPGSF